MRGRLLAAASCVSALAALTVALPTAASAQTVDGRALARDDLGTAAFLLALAGWIVYLVARSWWGRDRTVLRRTVDAEPSLELLDDPPVVVEALRSGGGTPTSVVGLVVLDLARRRYLDVVEQSHPDGRDWRFVRLERPAGELEPYENAVYTRLFASGNEASASGLVGWMEANRSQARVFVDRVRKYVGNEMAERGYLKEPSRVPVLVNLAAALVVGVVAIAAVVSGALLGLVALLSAGFQGSLSRGLRRRTATSADRSEGWFSVARGLQVVDEAETPPAGSTEEWDRLLVYAVALGVGETFVGALRRRSDVEGPDLAHWFAAEGDQIDRLQSAVRFPARLGQRLGPMLDRMPAGLGGRARTASAQGGRGAAAWRPGPSRPLHSED